MEITIEKENGEPMSEKEAADLLRFIRHQLKPLIEVEEEDCPFEPDNYSHDMEIFLEEDDFPWKFFEDLSYEGETELPTEVIAEQATAELSNGLLYIKLPKTEAVKPKTVAVK